MTMITPSYLGETIEYSSLHACRSTLEDPTRKQPRNTKKSLLTGMALRNVCITRMRFGSDSTEALADASTSSHRTRILKPMIVVPPRKYPCIQVLQSHPSLGVWYPLPLRRSRMAARAIEHSCDLPRLVRRSTYVATYVLYVHARISIRVRFAETSRKQRRRPNFHGARGLL